MFRRRRFDADLREELTAHLADREAAYIRDGLTPDEARRRARLDFGNPRVIEEQSRDVRVAQWADNARRDFTIAIRSLARTPAFTLAAIATFALGIGAATAIFSVAYGVAFRPLPYPDSDRIVRIYESNTKTNETKLQVSKGTFQAWREAVPSLEHAALIGPGGGVSFIAGDPPQAIRISGVSPAFFDVLGARPFLGSGFRPESDYTRFTAYDVVLSHAAWRRLFGSDPNVVGRLFYVVDDDDPFKIVGVMPEEFAFDADVDAWRPRIVELPVARVLRSWRYDRVVARLRPGRTIDQLRAELDTVSAQLARDFPATNAGWGATAEPLRDAIVGSFGPASWLLLAAVAAVLLVACANVAGLFAARSLARTRETSIRVALGAGGWRIGQFWFMEAFTLATAGAVAGVAMAWWLVRVLKATAPPGLPRVEDIAMDLPVLAMAAAATIVSALACAAFSLRGSRRRTITEGLMSGGTRTGDTSARRRTSTVLVAAQSSAALALVVLAVLFARSFVRLTAVDLGWSPDRLLSLDVSPEPPAATRRPWFWYAQWAERVIDRIEALPGVERATVTTVVPFGGQLHRAAIGEGRNPSANEVRWPVGTHIVSSNYFETLGLRLKSGRFLTEDDRFDESTMTSHLTAPPGAAVITQSMANALWPDQNPLGRAFRIPSNDNVVYRQVVGVVDDVQFTSVGDEPVLEVFVPRAQTSTAGAKVIVRTTGDPATVVPSVRAAILAEHPASGIDRVHAVKTLVDRTMAPARMTSQVVSGLGLLALVLAAVGVYGGLAGLVGARMRETAVRIALGASPQRTLGRTLAQGLLPVAIGGIAGMGCAWLLARSAQGLLYGVRGVDATSALCGLAVVLIVSALACLAPAIRAARTDPLAVLRGD